VVSVETAEPSRPAEIQRRPAAWVVLNVPFITMAPHPGRPRDNGRMTDNGKFLRRA
jgi:hypothetical protein